MLMKFGIRYFYTNQSVIEGFILLVVASLTICYQKKKSTKNLSFVIDTIQLSFSNLV